MFNIIDERDDEKLADLKLLDSVIPFNWINSVEHLPKSAGIYVLLLRLDDTQSITVGAKGDRVFNKGLYVYVGSAKGSGGIQARVGRHWQNNATKKLRWHIDYLRAKMTVLGCWVYCQNNKNSEPINQLPYHTKQLSKTTETPDLTCECEVVKYFASDWIKIGHKSQIIKGIGSTDCGCAGHVIFLDD